MTRWEKICELLSDAEDIISEALDIMTPEQREKLFGVHEWQETYQEVVYGTLDDTE